MPKAHKAIIIISAGTLFLILAGVYVLRQTAERTVTEPSPAAANENYVDLMQTAGIEFFVKNTGGYVAVYSSDSPEVPMEITNILVKTLTVADQEMLSRGVLILGEENLSLFLEDFGP